MAGRGPEAVDARPIDAVSQSRDGVVHATAGRAAVGAGLRAGRHVQEGVEVAPEIAGLPPAQAARLDVLQEGQNLHRSDRESERSEKKGAGGRESEAERGSKGQRL